jgi:signal transduction histidine kinase
VKGDATELEQAFVNLLANAFDAIEDKGTVRVETQKVEKKIQVKITDSGSGMDKRALRRLFDPFYTTKAPGKGTGLGLAMTHEIIEKMKGTIQVKSEPGKGTEVIVTL